MTNRSDVRSSTFWDRVGPYEAGRNKVALAMFTLMLVSYVLNAMDRQIFSVLATDVRETLGLSVPEIGLAATIFTLGMGVAGLPTAYLLSRVARKHVAIIGIAVFSLATFLTAQAQGLPDLLLYRFVSGLGEAMQLTALLAIGTTYFLHHRAVAASSLNFTFGIGAIIGPNLAAALLNAYDWRVPFIAFGAAGIPIIILIVFLVRPWFTEFNPGEHAKTEDALRLSSPGLAATDTGEAGASSLLSPAPLLLILSTAFAGLAIYGYLGLYPTFLREQLGFEGSAAGLAVSFYGLGAMLSLIGGWLGDRYNYHRVLAVALLISAVVGYFLFTDIRSLFVQCLLSFVFGGAISGMVYANLSGGIIKSMKRSLAGKASGTFVAALYIPAAFAGMLIGKLAEWFGWTTAGAIQLGLFSVIAALLALAAQSKRFRVTP
ncbi:MAG: transporter of the superfamily [Homoserinimonas sp.]|nr:transporter of the superfamily [Homoserinimonas sp.]